MIRIFARLIKHNKKIGRNLISLLFLNVALFVIILLYTIISNYYNNEIRNSILNRTLAFSSESVNISELKKIEDVEKVYKYSALPSRINEEDIYFDNINELEYEIVLGKNVIEGNEIVVSDEFLKSESKGINDKLMIDDTNFVIAGVYHYEPKTRNSIFFSENYANDIIDSDLYKMIIKDYDSLSKIKNILKEYNIEVNIFNDEGIKEVNMYYSLFSISKVVMLVIFVMLIIVNLVFISDIFIIYKKQIALLKVYGYRNWKISCYMLLNICTIYIIELLLYQFINLFLPIATKAIQSVAIIDIFLILINYVSIMYKLNRMPIIKLLKG